MINNWYSKTLIKVSDVLDNMDNIVSSISKINNVKSVYVWGSFLKNENEKQSVMRDLDIVARTNLFSEDLLSIEDNEHSPLKMASSQLEEEGFDPNAVLFTRCFTKITKLNIDHWAISQDKKILHWGPIIEDENERKEINKEAEDFAFFDTGIHKNNLKKASSDMVKRWEVLYEHHINKYLNEKPKGWNVLECSFSKALKSMRRIK